MNIKHKTVNFSLKAPMYFSLKVLSFLQTYIKTIDFTYAYKNEGC